MLRVSQRAYLYTFRINMSTPVVSLDVSTRKKSRCCFSRAGKYARRGLDLWVRGGARTSATHEYRAHHICQKNPRDQRITVVGARSPTLWPGKSPQRKRDASAWRVTNKYFSQKGHIHVVESSVGHKYDDGASKSCLWTVLAHHSIGRTKPCCCSKGAWCSSRHARTKRI